MNDKAAASELVAMAKGLIASFRPNFRSAEEFVDYLRHTLIPDLRRSGNTETAKDFAKATGLISRGKTDRSFVNFLKNTLIPDLEDSGSEATAEDFEEAVYWMNDGGFKASSADDWVRDELLGLVLRSGVSKDIQKAVEETLKVRAGRSDDSFSFSVPGDTSRPDLQRISRKLNETVDLTHGGDEGVYHVWKTKLRGGRDDWYFEGTRFELRQ